MIHSKSSATSASRSSPLPRPIAEKKSFTTWTFFSELLTLPDCRCMAPEAHQRGGRHQVVQPVLMVAFAVEPMSGTLVRADALAPWSIRPEVDQQRPAPQPKLGRALM